MSITTYAELKTAIENWNPHSDIPSVTDTLIDLAEARLSRDLRCGRMVITQSGTLSGETLLVPIDLVEVVELRSGTGTGEKTLEKRPLVDLNQRYLSLVGGPAEVFAIDGDVFRFGPVGSAGQAYSLRYYQRIPPLSITTTTNWLLRDAPDVYLFAAMVEADRFLRNPQGVAEWEAQLSQARESLIGSDRRARWKGGPQRIMVV